MKQSKLTFMTILLINFIAGNTYANFDTSSMIKIDDYYYYLDYTNNTAELTRPSKINYSGSSIEIPTSIIYEGITFKVASIGEHAFADHDWVKSITIPEGVTNIGKAAFANASGLSFIEIPNSVKTIGESAFSDYTNGSLISIMIGDGIEKIGDQAFAYQKKLKDLYCFANNVPELGKEVFKYINGGQNYDNYVKDKTLHIPALSINKYISAKIWSSFGKTTTIDSETFEIDSFYYNFNLATKEASIAGSPERSYSGDITIPSTVVFYHEKYNVNSIGQKAFYGCSNLEKITIPAFVHHIDHTAFINCANLLSIEVEIENEYYDSRNNCNAIIEKASNTLIIGCKNTIIPYDVISVGDGAFYGCMGLVNVIIPNSVISIGEECFTGCSSLESVRLSSNIVSIGSNAFKGCSINDVKVTIDDYSQFCNNVVIKLIKNSINKPVTLISNEGKEIKEYNIPEGVAAIGNYAFANCSGLSMINIPNSVTTIGSEAFCDCSGLTTMIIPKEIISINTSAFKGCYNILSVSINCSLISPWFSDFSSIKELNFGNEVTMIDKNAFRNCIGLKYVNFPNSIISIGEYAFSGCSNLSSIKLSPSITSIGHNAFSECNINDVKVIVSDFSAFCNNTVMEQIGNSIKKPVTLIDNEGNEVKEYNIPNDVTSIGNSAFENCSGLNSITIPNTVTTIGSDAFRGCSGITEITIPNSVTSIGYSAFYDCQNLSSLTIQSKIIGSWFSGLSSIKNLTIGNDVTTISDNAFQNCRGLNSVIIPNGVTSIGNSAFSGCSGLLSLTVGTDVKSIGQNAFYNTSLKKTIWLTNTPPSGYKNANGAINYVANEQYSNLNNKIVYPFISSLFEVDGIYYVPVSPSERTCDAIDCKYDETVNTTNISSSVSYKGIAMNVQQIQPYLFYSNKFVENLTCNNNGDIGYNAFTGCEVLKSVTCNNIGMIGDYAFESCSNISSLSLGGKVSLIGKNTFKNCSSLNSVTIPNSVTRLDNYSFSGCSSLSDIIIGNQVDTIGARAFENCKSLPLASIPKSVKLIDNYAFSGCTKLKEFTIENRDKELNLGSNGSSPLFADCPLDSVYIGGNITYNTSSNKGYSPFYRNTSLRTVVITDKETEISPNEFYGCSNLQNFSIGDGVTTFENWAFSGCSSLKNLSFGTQLKTIGKEAFSDCTAVTQIVSKAATPPACDTQALDDINKWNCTLYVPKGSLTSYQAANQWKEFFFIEEGTDNTGIGHVLADDILIQAENGRIIVNGIDEGTNITIYNINGTLIGSAISQRGNTVVDPNLPTGSIAIVKIGDKSVKIVVK